MKKALLLAPMGSVHRRFNEVNIKALLDLKYEVHLLANFERGEGTERQNPDYVEKSEDKGIIIHSLPFQRHEIKKNIKLVQPTRKLINNEHYDLIHAHTETGGLILRLVGETEGKRIYTPHGMSFYHGAPLKAQLIYRPIEWWICRGMDCNIAINKGEYDVLSKWNRNTARLVHGIGLDIERFQTRTRSRSDVRKEFGIPEDATVVLSVGELDDNKNHITVIEALKEIPNVYYLICGVGPNDEKLRNAGLGERLILAGYRRDIPDIIGACDLFAFPSFHEGMPVSLMEAIAGGLPVVCSRIRGNVDLVENELNGYTVEPENHMGWRHAVEELINNEELRQSFVKQSYRRIEAYSKDEVEKEYSNLYVM